MTIIKKIKDVFPNPTIDPIVDQPNYEMSDSMHIQINANAVSMHSHLENGRLGLMYLTVNPVVYNTLPNIPFITATNLGINPFYSQGTAQLQITIIMIEHKENSKFFRQFDACDCDLEQLVLDTVGDMFVSTMTHRYMSYTNVTRLILFIHIDFTYAN